MFGTRFFFTVAATVAAIGLSIGLTVGAAQAQTPNVIGTFNDWTAYSFSESGGTACFIASQPTKDEGNYTRRGDIYFIVTHRPHINETNVVSVQAGYPYRVDSEVEIEIGSSRFKLFTRDETAWAQNEADPRIVNAMRRGATMIVKGTSTRGTNTRDTYSLSGVTAAMNAINKACGVS